MQVFPNTSQPFYNFTVTLEDTPYVFDFFYSEREDRWYFSISAIDSTTGPIVAGLKVVCSFDLLYPFRYMPGLPPGALFALPSNADDSPPGLTELGPSARVSLYYLTKNEITTGVLATVPS